MDMDKGVAVRTGSIGPGGLWAAVVTGLLASLCCVGPLVLVAAGIGGAWVSMLTGLDPLRPWLTVLSVGLLGFAHIRQWRARQRAVCDCRAQSLRTVVWLWVGTALVAGALVAPYVLPVLIMPAIPTSP